MNLGSGLRVLNKLNYDNLKSKVRSGLKPSTLASAAPPKKRLFVKKQVLF